MRHNTLLPNFKTYEKIITGATIFYFKDATLNYVCSYINLCMLLHF